jgi:hypothetical protein
LASLPIDPCWSRWTSEAASSAATIEIIQFPCETPRGGLFDFQKLVLPPAPKTWPKTLFETKLLIDFMFLRAKEIWSNRTNPVPERLWAQDPALSHPHSAPENADPWSLACCQSLVDFRSLADVEWLAKQAQRMPARENFCRNLILNQHVASEARFMDQGAWRSCLT